MTIEEYTKEVEAITQPAEVAIETLREKAKNSVSMGELYYQLEQQIRSKVKTQATELTDALLKSLIGIEEADSEETQLAE